VASGEVGGLPSPRSERWATGSVSRGLGLRGEVAGDEGDGDSDEDDVRGDVCGEPGMAEVSRAGDARERHNDVLHDEEDNDAVGGSAEDGLAVEEWNAEACGVVEVSDGERDEVVEEDSEQGGGNAERGGFGSEEAAGHGLGHGGEGRVHGDGEVDDG
jgi:hypothetical protein